MQACADPSTALRAVPLPYREDLMTPFEMKITAQPSDIDELGHVNNAAWVRWIQDVATAHWEAVAPAEHRDSYVWVVIRHEIDYLRPAGPGETVTGRTWVGE